MHVLPSPGARGVRVLRGVLASSTATGVALGSHVAAGGRVPVPAIVVAVLVFGWLPGVALIGRRVRVVGQAAVIGVAEALLHLAFSVPVAAALPARGLPLGHVHAMPPMLPGTMHGVHASPGMWVAHLAAAIATLVAWHAGERAFWALVALALQGGRWLLRRTTVVQLPLPRPVPPALRRAPAPRSGAVLAVAPRRGPPRTA